MADDQPQVPGSNDELDRLVKQCEAAAEAVTIAKRNVKNALDVEQTSWFAVVSRPREQHSENEIS